MFRVFPFSFLPTFSDVSRQSIQLQVATFQSELISRKPAAEALQKKKKKDYQITRFVTLSLPSQEYRVSGKL